MIQRYDRNEKRWVNEGMSIYPGRLQIIPNYGCLFQIDLERPVQDWQTLHLTVHPYYHLLSLVSSSAAISYGASTVRPTYLRYGLETAQHPDIAENGLIRTQRFTRYRGIELDC